uniref:Sushi domain-containing protein n=1 Tax=Propithecus coquereli TaxID=379532 RepID=A0A2K6GGM5_PROCO
MSLARPSAPTVLCLIGGLYLLLLSAFSCLGDCSPPSEVPNAHPDLKGLSSFPVNSTVTYRCNEDFVKIPGQTDTVICLENDQWSEISEFCNRSCDVPPHLRFAMLKRPYSNQNYFPVGSTVEYECRLGYRRVIGLSGTLTCLQNFTWSKPADFCTKKSCPNPGELINGHINGTTDFLFGATIYFSCNTGYKLIGEKSSLCVIMGDNVGWTEQLPVCREIYCQEPPKIENGRIVRGEREQYVYSQAVMYACNRGFTLIGEDTIHCSARGDEGEWSGPAPQCRGNRVLYSHIFIVTNDATINIVHLSLHTCESTFVQLIPCSVITIAKVNAFFFFFETGSHSVSRPRVQWRHHSSLQPQTPGLKRSSCLSLLSSWDFRAHLFNFDNFAYDASNHWLADLVKEE